MSALLPIAALRECDDEAWAKFNAEPFPKALAAARSKLHGGYEEDACDIANKNFHALLERVHTVASSEELPGLLVTITNGEAMDLLRHQHAQKHGPDELVYGTQIPDSIRKAA